MQRKSCHSIKTPTETNHEIAKNREKAVGTEEIVFKELAKR